MPSIINATLSNGLVTSADNSGSLQLQTNNGTTAVTIDTSQNVGIGTTSPTARLEPFYTSTAPSLTSSSGAGLSVRGNSTVRLNVGSYPTSPFAAWIQASDNANSSYDIVVNPLGGNLLVGVTSGNGKVRIKQSADSHNNTLVIENFGNTNTWSFLVGSDNNLYLGYNGTSRGNFNNSTGAYTSTSDLRLKKNIETISHGLESVLALNPVSYNFKDETDESQQHLGFIAQEAQDILPSSVSAFADGTLGMDKQEIIPVLVKAIQELKAELDATKAEVQALKEGKQ